MSQSASTTIGKEPPLGVSGSDEFRLLKLEQLVESKHNPRKTFDQAGLEELAASIKAVGRIITPLNARPAGDLFEIAAGHRRLRAAKMAGLTEVPVIVRPMTDVEFIEVLNVENLQRKDLHELEEADGYRTLINCWRKERSAKGGQEASKEDVERVAERVGKSVSYVYQRLKLEALIPAGRKAFIDREITAGHAILIARLQPADQTRALQAARHGDTSVRELADWIGRMIHHSLESAPFKKDDPDLLPQAGACTTCPRRTGSNRELFSDVKDRRDNCTDPACYEKKLRNYTQGLVAELKATKQKFVKLTGEYSERAAGAVYVHGNVTILGKKEECPSAVKGVRIDGDKMGQVQFVCIDPQCKTHRGRFASGSRASKGDGKPAPLSDRRKALDRRRKALAVQNISLAVKTAEEVPDIHVLLRLALCFGTQTKRESLYDYDYDARKIVDPWSRVGEGRDGIEMISAQLWRTQILPVLLSRLMYDPSRDIDKLFRNAERVAGLVGVDAGKLLKDAIKALPDPKAWAKLNADGTVKKAGTGTAAKKKTATTKREPKSKPVQTSAKRAGTVRRNRGAATKAVVETATTG